MKSYRQIRKDYSFEYETVDLPNLTECDSVLTENVVDMKRWLSDKSFNDGIEAAIALAEEFDMVDEMSSPNHHIWKLVRDLYEEEEPEEKPEEKPDEEEKDEKEEKPKEEEEKPEPVNLMNDVLEISNSKKMRSLKLGDGTEAKIDAITADKILSVFDNLNDENKSKFIELLGREEATHKKAIVFVYNQTASK